MSDKAPRAGGLSDWLSSLQVYEPSPGSAGYMEEGGGRLTLSAFLYRVTRRVYELEQKLEEQENDSALHA